VAQNGERRIRGLDAEERRQQRRRQLLDSAFNLFGSEGYGSTSIEAICQHAYVSTKSFYEIFPNKEALYIALYDELCADLVKHLTGARESFAVLAPFEAVRKVVTGVTHAFVDDPRVARVIFVAGGAISVEVDEHRWAMRRQAAGLLSHAWAGLIRDATAEQKAMLSPRFATGVIGAFCDMIIDWITEPVDPDVQFLIDDVVAFFDVTHRGVLSLGTPSRQVS
jgi:AcrR family transcriptional regulator